MKELLRQAEQSAKSSSSHGSDCASELNSGLSRTRVEPLAGPVSGGCSGKRRQKADPGLGARENLHHRMAFQSLGQEATSAPTTNQQTRCPAQHDQTRG